MSTTDDVTEDAIRLARSWLSATAEGQTAKERRTTGRLAALVADPAGLELAVRFVDRVARPQDVRVAARELAGLTSGAAAGFLGPLDRAMLGVGALVAPVLPDVVVPAARLRLRSLVGHLVADDGPGLAAHLAATRAEGFRLNLNLLGEAVLGEREAAARLARVTALVERPDVDYVSVKVSAVASQLSTWDTDGSVRARGRAAAPAVPDRGPARHLPQPRHGGVPRPRPHGAGVRAARLGPGAPGRRGGHRAAGLPAGRRRRPRRADRPSPTARRAAGGARLKVRLVKGANLAMEQVEAELHGWPQAPYGSKAEVDAAYLRLVDRALDPARTAALRVGVASHNLFHVAAAHLLAAARGASARRSTSRCSRAWRPPRRVRCATRSARCCSTRRSSRAHDFDVAISYLVRRLEENSASQNFLHALFAGGRRDGRPGGGVPRRLPRPATSRRPRPGAPRARTPTHPGPARSPTPPTPTRPSRWPAPGPQSLVDRDVPVPPGAVTVSTTDEVDAVVARAVAAQPAWAATPPADRARALHAVAAAPGGRAGRPRRDDGPRDRQDRRRGRPRGERGRRLRPLLRRPCGRPRRRRRPRRRAPARRAHRGHAAVELPRRDPGRLGPRLARRGQPGAGQARTAGAAVRAGRDGGDPARARRGRRARRHPHGRAQPRGRRRTPARHPPGRRPRHPHRLDRDRAAVRRLAGRPRRPRRDLRQERPGHHAVRGRGPRGRRPGALRVRARRAEVLRGVARDPRRLRGPLRPAAPPARRRRRVAARRARDRPGHGRRAADRAGVRQAPARPDHARPGGVVAGRPAAARRRGPAVDAPA